MVVSAARKTYEILEGEKGRGATAFHIFITILILLNISSVILESEEWIHVKYETYLKWVETVSLFIFAGEYALRLSLYRMRGDTRKFALARYMITPMMLVDLAVIMPLFLPFLGADTRMLRILRLLRLFVVFKLIKMNNSLSEFGSVIRAKASDIIVSLLILVLAMVLASSLMYYAEREAQPETFGSISAAMWWGVVSFTTIGYGDTVPITPLGRVIGAMVALFGVAVYAIPAGIMASAFNEYRNSGKDDKGRKEGERGGRGGPNTCPHCGKSLE